MDTDQQLDDILKRNLAKLHKDNEENKNMLVHLNHYIQNDDARQLLLNLWLVIQAWDDAEDGDPHDHAPVYQRAMIDLPNNPLYQRCNLPLLIRQLWLDWTCANEFERNKEKDHLHKAYMLRAGFYRVMITLVDLTEGTASARRKAPMIWRCYGETYPEYEEEILCQLPPPPS